jgi:uncharacterized membrane protein
LAGSGKSSTLDYRKRNAILAPAMKIIVIVGLVAVILSLFSALFYLYRDRGSGTRMIRALALRVALSALLVGFLVFSYQMGWIAPTGMR